MYRQEFPRAEISAAAVLGEGVEFRSDTVEIGPDVRARHTTFCDNARVFGGSFTGSKTMPARVAGETCVAGDPTVISSVLCCDSIYGSPLILRSGIFDRAKVYGHASLTDVVVQGHARVYGDAVLDGSRGRFTVESKTRICAGVWRRPPRVADLGYVFLTEGPPGFALVDCVLQPIDRWLKIGPRYFRHHWKATPDQSVAVLAVLREWLPVSVQSRQ